MSHPSTGAGILINSESIAMPWREEILKSLKKCTKPPRLVGILSTASGPSNMYAEFTRKTCEELQIDFILRKVGAALDEDDADAGDVEEAIIECNQDPMVDGIMAKALAFIS
jgi:methylenetetrahydrofolate dehydrogenase (NAD+)